MINVKTSLKELRNNILRDLRLTVQNFAQTPNAGLRWEDLDELSDLIAAWIEFAKGIGDNPFNWERNLPEEELRIYNLLAHEMKILNALYGEHRS